LIVENGFKIMRRPYRASLQSIKWMFEQIVMF